MVKKKGQLQISFGMIFSIIIIIATIGISIYVINYFLKLGRCSELSSFYIDLQDDVDKAWQSSISRDVFEARVPSSIDSICFGNLSSSDARAYSEYGVLKRYARSKANVYIYPLSEACGNELSTFNLQHIKLDSFFCDEVKRGKISVKIEKESNEALVRVEKNENR